MGVDFAALLNPIRRSNPRFQYGELAETKAGVSVRVDPKEARNIAYAILYSMPIVPRTGGAVPE